MKFALNYSQQAGNLLQTGLVDLDVFKLPDLPEAIQAARALRPIYVHFGLVAGSGQLGSVDWKHIEDILAQTGTLYVNLHLYPRLDNFVAAPIDPSDPPAVDEALVIECMLKEVALAASKFGPERVIVENVPYPDPFNPIARCAVEPRVVNQVLDETGCGFLLDISHARIAAKSLKMDEHDYINALPVDRLRELHFAGLQHEGRWLRDHKPMSNGDWVALEWALGNIWSGQWARPWAVTFEYGGIGPGFSEHTEANVIAAQVPKLYELLKNGASPNHDL
jgi:uncharacterized protein (UPF0276 family)